MCLLPRLIFSAIFFADKKLTRTCCNLNDLSVSSGQCNDSRYVHRSRSNGRKCTCFYDTCRIRRHAPSPHLPHDVCTVCALTMIIIIIITRAHIVASTQRAGASRGPARPSAMRPSSPSLLP